MPLTLTPRIIVPLAARTANGDSGLINPRIGFDSLNIGVVVTATGGVGPTLDLVVEWSHDGGASWLAPETVDSFAQITAEAKRAKRFTAKAPLYRVRWTVGGTSPSFTFQVSEHLL